MSSGFSTTTNGSIQWLRSHIERLSPASWQAPIYWDRRAGSTKLGENATTGSSVIDLGCGPGFPITSVLVDEGLSVFGVDASPSFVAVFQQNLPGTPILCEAVQESRLFDRTVGAVLAWGLMFLLKAKD